MIQKGIIEKLYLDNNTALVRVPMYETSQGEKALFTCIIKTLPGIINGYNESDVVFVDFENDDLDHPVLVGKLFLGTGKEQESNTSINLANLEVTNRANFSKDFNVGNLSYSDIEGSVLATKDLYKMVNDTELYMHRIVLHNEAYDKYASIHIRKLSKNGDKFSLSDIVNMLNTNSYDGYILQPDLEATDNHNIPLMVVGNYQYIEEENLIKAQQIYYINYITKQVDSDGVAWQTVDYTVEKLI